MDPKPRDYASSDDELVVEDVTKTPATEEDASDSDEAPTAVVDAAADSDDDELMAVRKAEDDQRKARRKARIVAKENKKASKPASEKAARRAARVRAHPEDEYELWLFIRVGFVCVGFACGWCLVGWVTGSGGVVVPWMSKVVQICGVFASTWQLPPAGARDEAERAHDYFGGQDLKTYPLPKALLF